MSRLRSKTPAEEKTTGEYNAAEGIPAGGAFTCTECGEVATEAYRFPKENKLRYKCPNGHAHEIYWKI